MREFHQVMKEVEAGMRYTQDKIRIFLNDVTFEKLEKVVKLIYKEFGVSTRDIQLGSGENWDMIVQFSFPSTKDKSVGNKEAGDENASAETDQAEEQKIDSAEPKLRWISLTRSGYYTVDKENNQIIIGHKHGERIIPVFRLDIDTAKKIFRELPHEATSTDLKRVTYKLGVKIHPNYLTYLMRVFDQYVEFDCRLEVAGRTLILVKEEFGIAEENRKKMEVEKEVIGTPYTVEE